MRLLVKIMLAGCGGLVCLAVLAKWDSAPTGEGGRLWIGERVLWKKILHWEPVPVPMEVSKAGSEGVMVCSLLIDRDGKVTGVSVIQTPHPALADFLPNSFQNWAFSKTTIKGNPVAVTGKVILYLVNENDTGRFLTAEAMIEENRRWAGSPGNSSVQMVDVRERGEFELGHTPQSVNIPLDELQVRAPVELSLDRLVAIDCSRLSYDRCRVAVDYLKGEGFHQVTIEGGGSSQCPQCE